MKLVIVACLAASMAAAASWLILRDDGKARTSTQQRTRDAKRSETPAIARNDPRALARGYPDLSRPPPVPSPAPPPGDGERPPPAPLSHNAEDYKPFLQSEFEQQAIDPAWSRATRSSIQAKLGELLGTDRRFSVDCRATMCRIEVSNESMDGYLATAKAVAHGMIYAGAGFITRKGSMEDKDHTLLAFLAREGTALPDG